MATVPHALRGEEDELSVALTASHLQHHVHRYPTVHHVLVRRGDRHHLLPTKRLFFPQSGSSYHENVKLVQAAEGRLRDGPEGEDEADGGEGALATGQRAHVTQVGLVALTGLHLRGAGGEREREQSVHLDAAVVAFIVFGAFEETSSKNTEVNDKLVRLKF